MLDATALRRDALLRKGLISATLRAGNAMADNVALQGRNHFDQGARALLEAYANKTASYAAVVQDLHDGDG